MTLNNKQWRQALLNESSSLQDAIQNLEQTGLRIVMVLGDAGQLIGTVSDGDIRRGLLKGVFLSDKIVSVAHKSPIVVTAHLNRDNVKQLMIANKVEQIPIVDEKRNVIGLHILNELSASRDRNNLMLIMAGGKGLRLRPLTENCPKPMLEVAGKPMLEHILDRAKSAGFHHFIISVHYLGDVIMNYFENGNKWGIQIEYLSEDEPLGTAGALSLLQPLPTAPFVVTNGDVLTDINYGELLDFHIRHDAAATMSVRMHEWQHPYGVVQTRGVDIVGFEEKPITRSYINAGVYVLNPHVLSHMPNGHCDMPMLFEELKNEGLRTVAYPMHEPWLDIGKPEDLNLAREQQEPSQKNQVC